MAAKQIVKAKTLPTKKVWQEADQELTKMMTEEKQSSSKTNQKNRKKTVRASLPSVPPVEITLDSKEFMPTDDWARANLAYEIGGMRSVSISHRNSVQIDCGFSVKIPEGYRLVLGLDPWLKDNLEIYNNELVGDCRVVCSVRNVGRGIIVIKHLDRFASLRIEPIYKLIFTETK